MNRRFLFKLFRLSNAIMKLKKSKIMLLILFKKKIFDAYLR